MSGFYDIVGHRKLIDQLKKSIDNGTVSHAYIFNGEKGSGKKSIADAFAMALQCRDEEQRPCKACRSCKQAENHVHPDIIYISHEKPNSIGIDDVREQLIGDVQIKPYSSPYKIYIIPEGEKLTEAAQNAILKTIEEPAGYCVIMLLTSSLTALLPTLQSRCVVLNMKPVSDDQVKEYLMHHIQIPDYTADICVAFAQGNIGKAIQMAGSEHFQEIRNSALHFVKNVHRMSAGEMTGMVKGISEYKIDIGDYLDFLAVWYRDVLYFKATKDVNGVIFKDQIRDITQQTRNSSYEGIENILKGLEKAKTRLRANANFNLTMELLFETIREN